MSNCQISCANEIIVERRRVNGGLTYLLSDNFHGSNSWWELDIPPIERH